MTARARVLRAVAGSAFAVVLAAAVPLAAVAHPLGNFTINHFAALRVGIDAVELDVVIDRAEIPAFQEQQRLDLDGDGVLAAAELDGRAEAACRALASDLVVTLDGSPLQYRLVAAGLSLPPGAGGLPTMRLVCQYEASFASALAGAGRLEFADRSSADRIGWREIVVLGDGVLVDGRSTAGVDPGGASMRLTAYPEDLLAQPPDVRAISVEVAPGGDRLAAFVAPDAAPLGGEPGGVAGAGGVAGSGDGGVVGAVPVPGGIAEDLAALIDVTDVTPLAIVVSLVIAIALGAIHALSPGHGKTIMAAYLVGSGGSARQAVGLGLAVTVSHTLGVLALAGITLAASSLLPPDRLYPILGTLSGALVVAIGASLLWSAIRTVARGRAHAAAHHAHGPQHGHDHAHDHGHSHAHDHGHGHSHEHQPPAGGGGVSWRGLVALGLSGGLVPSASALILLLGSIAAGRVAYGLVLVLGFGLGMAVVLGGLGLAVVRARSFVLRRPAAAGLGRLVLAARLASAGLVVALGVVLTSQAIAQVVQV